MFTNAAFLKTPAALGRLTVSTASGDLDGDGDFDRIDVFGARSVSVRDQQGRLVWDSGDLLEQLSAYWDPLNAPLTAGKSTIFNTTNTSNARDNRSDDKGHRAGVSSGGRRAWSDICVATVQRCDGATVQRCYGARGATVQRCNSA